MPVSGALAGQPPAAAAPHEAAVHPGDPSATTIADKVLFGGAHGYLHEPDGPGQPLWTTYATGASVPVDGSPTVAQYL